jgi:hypothetical protein
MRRGAWHAVYAGVLMASTAVPVSADTIFEVEHARANARAGGPVNSQDAEFLERWGALSGTPEWRYRTRETLYLYGDEPAPRSKRHSRIYRD